MLKADVKLDANIKSLHVVRGIAALVVVFYHAKFALWSGGALYISKVGLHNFFDYFLFGMDMLSSCGRQCVLIFFILSGFVIHHSFQNFKNKLIYFYLIRIIRIYIPYIFSVFFSVAILLLVIQLNGRIAIDGVREYNTRLLLAFNDLNPIAFLKAIVFMKTYEYPGFNFAYWSLLHEGLFYLIYPLYFVLKTKKRIVLMGILLLGQLYFESEYIYYQLYFLFGISLHDLYYSGRNLKVGRWSKWLYYMAVLTGFILTNLFDKQRNAYLADVTALITIVLVFDYIITIGLKRTLVLTKLSDISFTLYLNHLPILLLCYSVFNTIFGQLIFFQRYPYYISVLLTVFISYLLYLLIERPSLVLISNIKKRWI